MIRNAFFPLLLLAASCAALPQDSVQISHVEANVPAPERFADLLKRDLLSFAKAHVAATATRVEYKLFREVSTQSGLAYPKYYAWVQVFGERVLLAEGAVRVAAVERTHFDVTHFMRPQEIGANPDSVQSVFPRPLVDTILERANSR